MKFLVHITCGPENPTKAALAVLIARTALDEGHETALFFAGDAAGLLRPAVVDGITGLGTGSLKAHLDAVAAGGGRVFVSGLSAKARGFADPSEAAAPVEFAMPSVLVRLTAEADRVLCY